MLSWICPDCGCDCSPTDQECPDCSDLVQAGMLALARAVQEQRDSLPPPPEIPLQDLVTRPPHRIDVRPPIAAAPRYTEPQTVPIPLRPPVLPVLTAVGERPVAPPPVISSPVTVPVPVTVTAKRSKGPLLPGWLISVLVATLLSLGGAAVIRNMEAEHKAEAASNTGAVTQEASDHSIEVTALRVLGGPRFGSQLQFIVVNHSANIVSNGKLHIAVRSIAAPANSEPLFTVSAVVTGLAPYSSREMTTDIQNARSSDFPGWDHLKAEVQVQ